MKCSSYSSIQVAARCHENFVIKIVCNAKLHLLSADVLGYVVLADANIGNSEEFFIFMLSNNFNSKHKPNYYSYKPV